MSDRPVERNPTPLAGLSTLSSNGRVTLPDAIRRELGLKPGDRIDFTIDGNVARFERGLDLEDIIGSLPPLPNASPEFEREIEEAIADALERKMKRLRGEGT
jgi:AbrB family looped-hinge helix DNA binding protein